MYCFKFIYMSYLIAPTFNIFSLIIIFIAIYFSFIVFIISDNKVWRHYYYILLISLFPIISILYVFTNNIIFFFYLYELFLLPSILLVYYLSPNKRAIIAVFYFLIWTQIGSFLIFLVIIIIINYLNIWFFYLIDIYYISPLIKRLLFWLLFIGFGIKVPIWPFYYWLTKTHVEAPTFFSIYLSGFLVKTALYGFYKLFFFLFFDSLVISFAILFFSIIDVSLKFYSQVDLKKLIAYSTVQEMNLIFCGLIWGTKKSLIYVALFSLTHTLLSTIFFFLVDVIYKRYYSRSIYNIIGIFELYPLLSCSIILACLNYNGFPFSLKFFLELLVFNMLVEINLFSSIILLIFLNWFGTVNFTYLWFRLLFGTSYFNLSLYNFDLIKKEVLLLWLTFYLFYQYIFILYFIF
jgi:NADH-quinone oxidoreductase subunit M